MSASPERLRKIAAVFTGQGAKITEKDHDFFATNTTAKRIFQEADDILQPKYSFEQLCFDPALARELRRPSNAQPALFTLTMAKLRSLEEIDPDFQYNAVAGHSLGEHAAAVAAEVLDWENALRLVQARGTILEENSRDQNGGILVVRKLPLDVVEAIAKEANLYVSNINSKTPPQIGLSGIRSNFQKAEILIEEQNGRSFQLDNIDFAPHCSLQTLARIETDTHTKKSGIIFQEPSVVFYANATSGAIYTGEAVRDALVNQIDRQVNWVGIVEQMIADGVNEFWEIGQNDNAINGLIRNINPNVLTHHANEVIYTKAI